MKGLLFLFVAIVAEVIATSTLKATKEFTRMWPSVIVVIGYGAAFYFMTLSLRTIPVGIAYAIWSGVGMVLIAVIAFIAYKQVLDAPAVIGMSLILIGVIVINVFSKAEIR